MEISVPVSGGSRKGPLSAVPKRFDREIQSDAVLPQVPLLTGLGNKFLSCLNLITSVSAGCC